MARRRQVVVIGVGRFGAAVATTLYEAGHEVLALDVDARVIQEISGHVTHAVQVDATDPEALQELGVQHFEVGIVGLSGDIERSILITLLLKRLGVPWVISKAQTALHGEILERVGADRVVFPEREMGVRLAHSFAAPNVVDYMPVGPDYGISKLEPPEHFLGKRVGDLDLRARYGLTLLLIE
ncbi:MAG TPA: TrkA family potassium uptake protein, partial [Dehalococcoidia bacterium]